MVVCILHCINNTLHLSWIRLKHSPPVCMVSVQEIWWWNEWLSNNLLAASIKWVVIHTYITIMFDIYIRGIPLLYTYQGYPTVVYISGVSHCCIHIRGIPLLYTCQGYPTENKRKKRQKVAWKYNNLRKKNLFF